MSALRREVVECVGAASAKADALLRRTQHPSASAQRDALRRTPTHSVLKYSQQTQTEMASTEAAVTS